MQTVFRRLDDDYCDPLELRGDSALGVAGLIGAIRAGNLTVANALGSGVLESAAWFGFLPAVAERLLGEKLLLPEVATWWCGERPALDYVLANLDHVVIKPTYPNQRFEPIFGRDTQGAAREELITRLRNRPYAYVAQEHVNLSQAPVWRGANSTELDSRALTIRVYACKTRDGVHVMPGGLARIAQPDAADVVSSQRGGGAKDIWVLRDDQPEPVVANTPQWTPEQRRNDIPSRLVENLFWLGRYSVRCENKLRLLRGALSASARQRAWALRAGAVRDPACHGRGRESGPGAARPGRVRRRRRRHPAVSRGAPRRCATACRCATGAASWRCNAQLQEASISSSSPREHCERLLLQFAALSGFCDADMTRDEGWHGMQLGRAIERTQFLAAILDASLSNEMAARSESLEWLLEVGDSLNVYRQGYALAAAPGAGAGAAAR